jgi:cathepsin B
LSDTGNLTPCKSKDNDDILPDSFDARNEWASCFEDYVALSQGKCSATHALTTVSVVADRICIASESKKRVPLSTQDVLSCDVSNHGCDGGFANRVLNFGKKKGFVADACQEYTATSTPACPAKEGKDACREAG